MLKEPQTPRYAVRRTHRTYTPQFKAELYPSGKVILSPSGIPRMLVSA